MSNTKKMWIRILCLTFVLFSIFALNSCDENDASAECEHTWGEWTVVSEASCEEDGEKQRVCSECEETETRAIAALSHDFGEWSVTKAATCTEEGEETRVCSRNSEHTETRTVAKIAHTFDVEKEDVAYLKKEGSCTEKAVYYKSCKCGEKGTETFESGTPSHTYDREVVDAKFLKSEATCTAKAVYYKSCECGAFDAESSETFESGATIPHTYGESVVAPRYLKSEATCTDRAVYYKSCKCGAFDALASETFESGSLESHKYDRAVVDAEYLKSEANCNSAAVYYKSCKCGAFDTGVSGTFENGDKTPHVYDRAVAESKYVKTPASCTEKAVYYKSCKCGAFDKSVSETFESGALMPHSYDKRVVDAKYLKSEATCTSKAVYYKSCKCGDFDTALSDTFKSGEMLPHIYDREVVSSEYLKSGATCTAKAVYYKSCECGHKGSATFEYGNILPHVYNKEVVADRYLKSGATCTELGVYYKSCECGAFDADLSATFSGGELIPHTYNREEVADKYLKTEATCTAKAVYYKSCECGAFDRYDSETFESGTTIAHTYDREVVDSKYIASEATCTLAATYYKSCKCGAFDASLSATFAYGEPIAHTYDREVVEARYLASAATCEARARYYKSCKCGAHDNALSGTFEYGDLQGHNHVQIAFTAATCTVDGVRIEECTVCGDTIETPIIAQGHNYVDEVVEPKCLTVGYTKHTCSECGDNYSDSEVPATGHLVFDDRVIAPTCEDGGYTEHKCNACGFIEKINPTAKLGHDYQEQILTPADCKTAGTKKISCSRCDYENTETIPTTDHNHNSVTTPATCTVDGYITYTCVCGDTYTVAGEAAQGHSWSKTPVSPTCTEQGYTFWECDNCDAEEKHDFVAANGHSFSAATCAEPERCACGATGAAATGNHNYVGVETTAPTCTVKGVMTYTCGTCGDSYTEDISATGHNTEGAIWTETEQCIDGKCTYVKISTTTCLNNNCGVTVSETSASYEKHSYLATITQAATCTVPGIKTYKCTVCGGQPAENATVEYSEASGHTWIETASTTTTKSYECSACGETKTVVHSDGNSANVGASDLSSSGGVNLGGTEIELDSATKEQLGQITQTENITVSVNKIEGNDRNDLVNDETQLEYIGDAPIYDLTMLIGGDENNKISNFNGKVTVRIPYTLESGDDPENLTIWYIDDNGEVSTIDGATYVVIGGQGYAVFETDHFSYYTVTKLTPAERCERDGHIEKTIKQNATCLIGGYEKTVCTRCGEVLENKTTPALGHNWSQEVISEATCDEAGQTKHSCDRCKLVYYTVTAAIGHKWAEDKTVEASCSETGYILYICENNKAHTYTVVIPKKNHSYVSVVTKPTCTTEGYTTHTCSDCGASYISDRVKATEHKIVTKVVEPTCISEGYTAQSCEKCGQRFKDIDIVPKTGHSWDIEAPTCSKGQTCTVCNAAGDAATGEHNMTEKGECSDCGKACEHKFYQGEVHAPTCIENGYTEYICNFCGLVENRDVVEHGDHTWKDAEHKAATCTDDGYDKWICSVCGETKTEIISHGDGFHKTSTKVVAPTCEEEGYTLQFCKVCGQEIERTNAVPATGHKYEVIENVEATCEKDGYIIAKCAGCGHETEKVLEATGHSYSVYEVIEPECGKEGATVYKCSGCGSTYEEPIEALKHNFEQYGKVEPTCEGEGAILYRCTACGVEIAEIIKANGHNYELSETVDSTCTVNGKKIYACTACDSTVEEELELADHNYVDGKCEACGKEQSSCKHASLEDCDVTYKFINGSTSCEEGVEVIYTCPNCEQVVISEIRDGHIYRREDISADFDVAGNIFVEKCIICDRGDIYIKLPNCQMMSTTDKHIDEEGNTVVVETYLCVDCGFSYTRKMTVKSEDCRSEYEYVYTFGKDGYTVRIVNIAESHNYFTEWEEFIDEENLTLTEVGIRSCKDCGKVFYRRTDTMKYLAEDIPLEFIETLELALDDKGTEFILVEKEAQRAEYEITEDGEYIPVAMVGSYTTYNSKGEPATVEEEIEKYTADGDESYFYAALYNYICGEKVLIEYEEEEYVTVTLPGGYEKNFIASNKAGEYDINGEVIYLYEETYTYEIIEGESCKINVTYSDSEGNTDTFVKEAHVNVEKFIEFAEGSNSCTQGVYTVERCTVCETEINRTYRTHHSLYSYADDEIDAGELGCECGGFISRVHCEYCDYESVNYHFNCDMSEGGYDYDGDGKFDTPEVVLPVLPNDSKYDVGYGTVDGDIAYDEEIGGDNWGEIVDGDTTTSTFKTEQTCRNCGFSYSVEWYTERGENCQVTKYYTYSFGKDADGNALLVIETVDDSSYTHSYTSEEKMLEDTYETQADGSVLLVTVFETKTYCVSCGHVSSYERVTVKRDTEGYVLYEGREHISGEGDNSYVSEKIETIYEKYKHPDGTVETRQTGWGEYRYNQLGEEIYFSRDTYIYNDETPCIVTVIWENSNGDREEHKEENHEFTRVPVLVEGAESCEDGVRIVDRCTVCGYEEDEGRTVNWHYTVNEHIDFAPYGSICGAWMNIETCACGQSSYIYFERAGMFNIQNGSYKDENGNMHKLERGECMADGFWYEIDYYSVRGENCSVTEYSVYRFGNSESKEALLEKSIVRERKGAHKTEFKEIVNETTQEFDEVTGEVLNVHTYEVAHTCMNCGTVTDHYRTVDKNDKLGNSVYHKNENFFTASNGVEYLGNSFEALYMSVKLADGSIATVELSTSNKEYDENGNLTWFEDTVYEYVGGYCEYIAHRTNSDGNEWEEKGENHGATVERVTLMEGAETCDDGVICTHVCLLCGKETYRTEFYHHYTVYESVDLSEYGCKCGGQFDANTCACGMYNNFDIGAGCAFESTRTTVVDAEGNKHTVTTYTCMNCNFSYSRETWRETGAFCHTYYYTVFNIGLDAEGNAAIVKTTVKDAGTSHNITTEGGEAIKTTETDENGNILTVVTTEIKNYCLICGTVETHFVTVEKYNANNDVVYKANTNYAFADGKEYICNEIVEKFEIVLLANGNQKQLLTESSNYTYAPDGSILEFIVYEYEYTEGDYCNVKVTYNSSNGSDSYTEERHGSLQESFALMEGATNCYEGVLVTNTCLDCGKVVNTEEIYRHVTRCETVNLSEYGSVCGDFIDFYSCPCGENNHYKQAYACAYTCVESKYDILNGFERAYEAYRCMNCGFEYTYERWTELDENCNGAQYTKYSFGKDENGNPLGEKIVEISMKEAHNWTYDEDIVESVETDENGNTLKVITTERTEYCSNCAKRSFREITVEKFDDKGNIVFRETSRYYTDEKGEYLSETVTSTFATGVKADGTSFTYEASRKTLYHYGIDAGYWCQYTYTYKDGNWCTRYVTMTASDGNSNSYVEENHGEYKTVVTLMDGAADCNSGVIVSEMCVDCGTVFKSYDAYHHYMVTERIDASTLGCGCGGEVVIDACACGYQSNVHVKTGCTFNITSDKVDNGDGTTHNTSIYACDICGFSYTYERWNEYDENCVNYNNKVYKFGLDKEGNPLLVKEIRLSRGENHSYSGINNEAVETTEIDKAGNELRVVTTTESNSCTRCGRFGHMNVTVEKYLTANAEMGDEICVYICKENYIPSVEAENGIYLHSQDIWEYGYYTDAHGKLATYPTLEYIVYYNVYGEIDDFQRYEYSYKEGNYCVATVLYTNFYGDKSEEVRTNHSEVHFDYILSKGSESCADGIDLVELCVACGTEISRMENYTKEHLFCDTPSSVIDLEQYGSVCGGELQIFTCPCGKKENTNIVSDCPFNYTGEYYTYTAADGSTHTREIMTCPVTDPELCGFSYVYIDWQTSDENCMAVSHRVILLGVDAKTGDYAYKYEATYGEDYYNHSMINSYNTYITDDGKTVTESVNTCEKCGAISYKNITTSYVDENGDNVFEQESYYYRTELADNAVLSHNYRINITRDVKVGDETRSVTVYTKNEEYGYLDELMYWTEESYVYNEESCCTGTRNVKRYHADKDIINEESYDFDNHSIHNSEIIVEATCTQVGIAVHSCGYCDYSYQTEDAPMGHMYQFKPTENLWICRNCGLENFTGVDGEVIFEDLTARRGDGSRYIVGYRNHWGSEYIFSLYLVIDGEELPIDLEAIDDGKSLVYIDVNAVAKLAEAMGYKPCAYMVCLRFVPIGDDSGYYYDFAITLDPHAYAIDEENSVIPEDPCTQQTVTAYKCVLCGDSYTETVLAGHDTEWISNSIGDCGSAINVEVCKVCDKIFTVERQQACDFEYTCSTETDENGITRTIENYVCRNCGASYAHEYYTISKESCFSDEYSITRWGLQDDGSYAFEATVVTESESHIYVSKSDITEEGYTTVITKTTACEDCGKISSQNITTTVVDENGHNVSQLIDSLTSNGVRTKNYREYFTAENGGSYESIRTFERIDANGVLTGYTMVYEYDFEAGVRYWTRTDVSGKVTEGKDAIK
ncbi:MAG: hypothetical protein J6A83_04520 [Clostridia bacterium]|nr:hypothetical protein [Clostridia bacterium]